MIVTLVESAYLNLQSKLVIKLKTTVSLQGIKLMVVFVNKYNHLDLKLHNPEMKLPKGIKKVFCAILKH
jgi:hypothetical protein